MKTYLYRAPNLKSTFWPQFHGGSQFLAPAKNRRFLRFIDNNNWASEASPTLGCSIEITRDIYMYILEKWFPLQGERAHCLKKKKVFDTNLNSIQSFFCSSFFLHLQGQPELCHCYHLLQSCFSFYVRLHGKLELFASDHLL